MPTFAERLLIARCWLASFAPGSWRAESYPIVVRQQVDVPPEASWCARVLNWPGPVGLGHTAQEARSALLENLAHVSSRRISEGKRMPRPGTGLPIEFASTARVGANAALLDEFVAKILGFGPSDSLFISDESTLGDFGGLEELAFFREKIKLHYGLDLHEPGPVPIVDILERVRANHAG